MQTLNVRKHWFKKTACNAPDKPQDGDGLLQVKEKVKSTEPGVEFK